MTVNTFRKHRSAFVDKWRVPVEKQLGEDEAVSFVRETHLLTNLAMRIGRTEGRPALNRGAQIERESLYAYLEREKDRAQKQALKEPLEADKQYFLSVYNVLDAFESWIRTGKHRRAVRPGGLGAK